MLSGWLTGICVLIMNTADQELIAIEDRLNVLEQERHALVDRKQVLLNIQGSEDQPATPYLETLSPPQKIELFSSLFKGRKDIFALRWENRQGRSGYTVACANEWKAGICNKPRIKCSDCTHRSFSSLNDTVLFDHLAGKHTVGLYPLLPDNNCWLLAVDFDKSDWQQAATALRNVCKSWSIDCVVEISRSGNGAHLWIFFNELIPAKDARKLGFMLLDKAMEQHASLSFDSYDRLFPNQDIMPEGGFGNLIALPLQHTPRQTGSSVFVNEQFQPYPNQWEALSLITKIERKQLYDLLDKSEDKIDDLEIKPWEKSLPVKIDMLTDCPTLLTVVLANKIYLPVGELPQALVTRIKRLASFSNPVFFKTQALRFSTNGIPRFICLANIEQGYIAVPRGCIDEVMALLEQQSIEVNLDDKRRAGMRLKGLTFEGELRSDQKSAIKALGKHDVGILHAPTAFGKTVVAIGLIQKRKVNTLILVHSRQLLDQWKERLKMFLGGAGIGVIGGGKRKASGQVDVATYQSLINRKSNTVDPLVFEYGQIIIDECHHISAPNYERLLNEIHAKYVLGVTATPQRQDGHQPIIFMQSGPIRHVATSASQQQFEQRVIVRSIDYLPPMDMTQTEKRLHISDVYRWLMTHTERNHQIIDDIVKAVNDQRNPIVLTERREHALLLGELLANKGIAFEVLLGGMKSKVRKAAMDALEDTNVLIATGKYIGEGFDLSKLDTLFLALPISWKGSLIQYAGRIHRQAAGKEKVIIYDYVDSSLPMLQRMFQRRKKGYDALGYTITNSQNESLVQAPLRLNSATPLPLVKTILV
jgi:superfamily II DNA or RNA helicase